MSAQLIFQGLIILVALQTIVYLLFHLHYGSKINCLSSRSEIVFCDKCRYNVVVDVNENVFKMSENSKKSYKILKSKSIAFGTSLNKTERLPLLAHGQTVIGLKDINKSVNNVFFIEARCGTSKLAQNLNNSFDLVLGARQSCAVESIARTNPGRDIYIAYSCPLRDDFLSRAPEYARKLLELQNVHVVRFTLAELFQDSPVQQLFESGRMDKSDWVFNQASNVARILLLWMFGGTYSDFDTVTIRNLDLLGTNFAGYQDESTINSAVLNFEPFGFGHDICTKALLHLNKSFNGAQWGANGPGMVTKVINEECDISGKVVSECGVFTVFHPSVLYPVYYPSYALFFDNTSNTKLIEAIKATAFSVHFWNKMSKDKIVHVGSNQTYALLADEFCPGVYRNCGPTF